MKQARVKLLQSMPLFGGASQRTLEFLIDLADMRSLGAGEFFFHEGEDATSMFVLEQGRVSISKQWNGHPHLIKQLKQGDCFGEMALLDLYPRSASVMAVEPCRAIELTQSILLKLYEYDIEQFTLIQMNIGREISRRLRLADDQLFRSKFGPQIESAGE